MQSVYKVQKMHFSEADGMVELRVVKDRFHKIEGSPAYNVEGK